MTPTHDMPVDQETAQAESSPQLVESGEPAQLDVAEGSTQTTDSFPLDALPPPLRQFTKECAASLPVAPEVVGIPALVVAGAAIGNTRAIRLKEGWTESTALWAAIVASSGTKKSPAVWKAAAPLLTRDSKECRTWAADITVEQLAALLVKFPRGLFSYRDELSAWVKSMNQYRAGKGVDRPFFLSLYSGAPTKVDRKGSERPVAITLANPWWAVVGGLPPDIIGDLEDEGGKEDGFLPRLLFTLRGLSQSRFAGQTTSSLPRPMRPTTA